MPATALTVRTINQAGLTPLTAETAADNLNGNSFVNGPNVWLEASNTAGTSQTVTIVTPGTVGGNAIADKVITLATTVKVRIGPLDPAVYGDPVTFTASAATVTVAVYQLSST